MHKSSLGGALGVSYSPVAASGLIPGGTIPARAGRWSVGVALRQPETVGRAELRAVSSNTGLRQQTGAQYSVTENSGALVVFWWMLSVWCQLDGVSVPCGRCSSDCPGVDSVVSSVTPRCVNYDLNFTSRGATLFSLSGNADFKAQTQHPSISASRVTFNLLVLFRQGDAVTTASKNKHIKYIQVLLSIRCSVSRPIWNYYYDSPSSSLAPLQNSCSS